MEQTSFKGMSDHDLLITAVTELGHIKTHVGDLAKEAKVSNGRIRSLETWQIRMGLVLTLFGSTWPLLIQEVRQFLLEKFGFIREEIVDYSIIIYNIIPL